MLNRLSNRLRDWINRTEPPSDHQQPENPVDGLLNAFSLQPKNDSKLDASTNGTANGSNSEKRENGENLQDEKKEIKEDTSLTLNEKGDENESMFQNEKEFEVTGEAEQERNRGARFPVRSGAEDCSFCLENGLCEFGTSSESNHPHNGKRQVNGKNESLDSAAQEVKEKDDSRAERIDCKNFDHPGGCNSEKSSRLDRRRRASSTVELNFMGLPIRLGKKDCPYYMHHGSCKFGANCWYNHPDPTCVGGSDSQSGHSYERSVVSLDASLSTLGSSSPAALGDSPPFAPLMFSSTLGSSSPAALSQGSPYVPLMIPSGQGPFCQPGWHAYPAPVYLPETGMQPASAYATNSQPLERSVYTHQQHRIMIDEFPETPGQPDCSSFLTGNCIYGPACRFHHPKNRSAKSTSSGLNDSCLPSRHAMQPLIPEAVVSPSHDASFTKNCVGQNSVPDVHKTKPKQPKAIPKKKSANQNVRCDLCKVECPSIQLYEEHLSGKKHINNLQKLHASRMSPAAKAIQPIDTNCSAGQMGTPSGEGMAGITSLVTNLESKKKEGCSAGEAGTPSGKGISEVTIVVTDLEKNIQKSSSADVMGTPSGKDKVGVTSVEIDSDRNKQESCSDGVIGTSGGKGTVRVTSVVADLEAKKQKLLEAGIAAQFLRICTICNVVCNGEIAFAEHMAGKKHLAQSCRASEMGASSGKGSEGVTSVVTDFGTEKQRSFSSHEMGTPSGKGTAGVTSAGSDLETKKQGLVEGTAAVQSLGVCTMSRVFFDGDIAFAEHMAEKMHLTQEQALVNLANGDPASVTNPNPKSNEEISKKTNDDQSAWCELCNIRYTSVADIINHEQGKKHKKNMEKSKNMRTDPANPASTASSKDPEAVETKKQKVLGCGAAANAVRECAAATLADPNPSSATYPKPNPNEEATMKANSVQSAWCEVCKISFATLADLSYHEQGKKHKNNMEKSQNLRIDATSPPSSASSKDPEGVETKKQKEHAFGTKAVPNPTSATNPKPKPNEEATKKTNNALRARCEICKVSCTSLEDLNHHKQGKKHKANVGKLQKHAKKTDPTPPAPTAASLPSARSKEPKDLEAKKQRVLGHGAPAVGVRICTICKVVCNSETVYNDHLAGQKHAATVKQKQAAGAGRGS